jgi:hypothetical protein
MRWLEKTVNYQDKASFLDRKGWECRRRCGSVKVIVVIVSDIGISYCFSEVRIGWILRITIGTTVQ